MGDVWGEGGWGGEGRDAAIQEQTSDNVREERGGTCLTGSSLLHLKVWRNNEPSFCNKISIRREEERQTE